MVDKRTLWGRFAGCQKGLPRGFPVVGSGGGIVGGWSCRTFWEFGKGFRCDGWLADGVGRGGMKGADKGDATEAEGHAGRGCATVAQDGRSFKNGLDKFLLVSARFFTPKCRSQADAEETRSRRASSSPSWSLVRFFLPVSPFLSLTSQLGASGTGRTTFVNTLCESEVLAHKVADNPDTAHIEEGIRIKPANVGTVVSRSLCSLPSNPTSRRTRGGWRSYCPYHR